MDSSDYVTDYTTSTATNAMVLDTEFGGLPRTDYEAMPPLYRFLRSSVDRKNLWDLFDLTKIANCLNMAIEAGQVAVDTADEAGASESDQANAHLMLAMLLQIRSLASEKNNLSHVTAAIEQFERALERAVDSNVQATCLSNLSGQFSARYQLQGHVDDLKRAEDTADRAVEVGGEDCPHRRTLLHNHALALRHLYGIAMDGSLLEKALECINEAVDLAPPQSKSWVLYKTERASILQYLYEKNRNLAHLQTAIGDCESFCDEGEAGTYDLSNESLLGEHWLVFSQLLSLRFDILHVRADIDRSLQAGANALNALPRGHPSTPSRLANLAEQYFKRFEEYSNRYDLDEAIRLAEEAFPKLRDENYKKWQLRISLSRLLATRYRIFKDKADIDRAVELMEDATNRSKKEGSESELSCWAELASVLHSRATFGPDNASDRVDLERAVELSKRRLNAHPMGSAERAGPVNNVGIFLVALHKMTGSTQHLDEGVEYLRQCSQIKAAPPIWRINAAKRAIDLLMAESRFPEADELLRSAVSLLRRVSPRSLELKDQQAVIKKFASLATLAASIALQTGAEADDALQLLEDGRGIILGLLFEARSDVEVLRTKRGDLAMEFERLRDEIDAPVLETAFGSKQTDGGLLSSQALTRREHATAELDKLLDVIRHLGYQELEHFMESPKMDKLKAAAAGGFIVVVNVSSLRSDAFIVRPNAVQPVQTIPLPDLGLVAVEKWAKLIQSCKITEDQMFELLEWLWNSLGCPVLRKLDEGWEDNTDKPAMTHRVWWIPTASLSCLPIHAAGVYDARSPPEKSMLVRAISSYSPFIKAMLFTQGNKPREDGAVGKSLLIRMAKTEGQTTLLSANTEVEIVRDQLAPVIDSKDLVVLEEPTKTGMLSALPGSTILHFAGHGKSDTTDPLLSTLLTQDWRDDPLTVKDLMALKLHRNPPLLAYLSACSTGSTGADNLADEGLHLMSACQLVGFRHVVGSLWAVSDRHCVDVAQTLYATMVAGSMRDDSVSLGLRDAVRGLHSNKTKRAARGGPSRQGVGPADQDDRLWFGRDPRVWAAYVHIGP